jgi:hypothetical protein
MIHFILTGDEFKWQYKRAIETAEVHGRDITLWCCGVKPEGVPEDVVVRPLAKPTDIPEGTPDAHIWDVLAYKILFAFGGTCLGLDTISINPIDPLEPNKELGVGLDVPTFPYFHPDHKHLVDHPYNNNGISAPIRSAMAGWLHEEALLRIKRGGGWEDTGPAILTELVEKNRNRVQIAPFPQLCGWEGSYTWQFYAGDYPEPDVRVIHLFASAYQQQFEEYGKTKKRSGLCSS